ncbi:MAG: hypothetical protein V3V08_16050 [Nannocystaceae bacterium]
MRMFVLVMGLLAASCTSEEEAIAFAASGAHILPGEALPEDAGVSHELAFVRYDEAGWETEIKTPGAKDQPQNSERAAAVDSRGPKIVWLPVHWEDLSKVTKARMAWHELTHINQQAELGRDRMARLLIRKPYWRIAAEVAASAQSLEVLARYGADEDAVHQRAEEAVEKYPGRIDLESLEEPEEWYDLARQILHDRADAIFSRRRSERLPATPGVSTGPRI